jgi:hypothetical protein
MFGAGGPGAETGAEIVQSVEGGSRPAHEGWEGTMCATAAACEMARSKRVNATATFTGCHGATAFAHPRTLQAPRHRELSTSRA